MAIDQKYMKDIRQFIGTFIVLSIIWSITSFLSTKSLSIDPVAIVFGFQGYFVYIISRDKVKVAQRTIFCFVSTYLGISLFDWLNIHEVSITIPVYLVLLSISVSVYAYLRIQTKKEHSQ